MCGGGDCHVQKDHPKKVVDCSKSSLDLATEEIAGFIVFQLSTVDSEAQFSFTFKLKTKIPKSKSDE